MNPFHPTPNTPLQCPLNAFVFVESLFGRSCALAAPCLASRIGTRSITPAVRSPAALYESLHAADVRLALPVGSSLEVATMQATILPFSLTRWPALVHVSVQRLPPPPRRCRYIPPPALLCLIKDERCPVSDLPGG